MRDERKAADLGIVVKQWEELTAAEVYALAQLRSEVFVRAQRCDDIELDGRDLEPDAIHIFVLAAHSLVETPANPEPEAQLRSVVAQNPPRAKAMAGYLRVIRTVDEFAESHPWTIGRVVVDPRYRGQGIAEALMGKAVSLYDDDSVGFVLHAQTQAKALYSKLGFKEVGETFYEAGIEHVTMTLR